ncbi:MAG: TlpA family protein disulfide reductase [Verrucomicrobia bacterium]|nr:TlpA family protein disulfide reductase [Verrucomicrobiota bacterium]
MNMSHVKKSLLVGALALSFCNLSVVAGDKGIKVGDAFPDLGSFSLEGKMPETTKGKVVLVDFWASWCGPCKESFPVMEELQKQYGPKGLIILAVNLDDDAAAMQDFLKSHPVSFTVVRDAKKKMVSTVNIASMPSSFVLGPDGKVAAIHKGFYGKETSKQYAKEIEGLLSGGLASK